MSGGAAATSDPRATGVAVDMLAGGGNAVDAAVAAAFALMVVEPHYCGLGGDAFLLLSRPDGPPVALDGSGAVPAALAAAAPAGADVPARGADSITVPGAAELLDLALRRFGSRTLAEVVAPATALAAEGFAVRRTLAVAARRTAALLDADPVLGPLYAPGGRPVQEGDVVRNPALGTGLERLVVDGARSLYEGPIAAAIADVVVARGGPLTLADLAAHEAAEMAPASTTFRGHVVWELPEPTQGPAVLHALDRLDGGGAGIVGAEVDWDDVVAATNHGMRAAGFDPAAVAAHRPNPGKGDTTYIAVVDEAGTAASLITSVFGEFGSMVGVPALGGPLHNRAAMFLMLGRPVGPGKPPHTTIPALVTAADTTVALGVAGGMLQPQVQVQILVRMLVEGADPATAVHAPRFKTLFGGDLACERGHPLAGGHPDAVDRPGQPAGYGAAQVAGHVAGRFVAAADSRRDGAAVTVVP